MTHSEFALVGDVGGSNMRLGVGRINPETQRAEIVGTPNKIDTPSNPDRFFRTLARGVVALRETYPELQDGAIGFPGPVDIQPGQTIVGPITNLPFKDKFDLAERLVEHEPSLADFQFMSLNDAEAATYAAPFVPGVSDPTNQSPLTYITHSTGIGGETIRNFQISSRLTGQLAEYGHMQFRQDDGSFMSLEQLISGPNMEKRFGKSPSGKKRTIFQLATSDDDDIPGIWDRAGREFAHGLGMIIPIVGPSDIVIGGGISRDHHLYEPALRDELGPIMANMPVGMFEKDPTISFVPAEEVEYFGLTGARIAVEVARKADEDLAA